MSKITLVAKKEQISTIDTPHLLKNSGHSHLETYSFVDYKKTGPQKDGFQKADSFLDRRLSKKRGGQFISLRDIDKLFENDSLSQLIKAAACNIIDEIQKKPDKYSY